MICFPNAKINLGLNIVSRRQDGYHNLETIFYPVGLKDALEIIPSPGNSKLSPLFLSGNSVEGKPEDNLAMKALKLLSDERELPPMEVHLLKKIPTGAGLGGGSSDAAFMLHLLNDTFKLGYNTRELMAFASRIGADCPYFLVNKPAIAKGIGDIIEPVSLDLRNYYFVLVKPGIAISTKDAYGMIVPQKPEISLQEIIKMPVTGWKSLMKNDFEGPIFKKYPDLCRIKEELYQSGAVYAAMSGSGSAIFGLFKTEPRLPNSFLDHFIWKRGPFEW